MMNVQDLAARLDGCQMGQEMTRALEAEAKAAGLVVVFGASDDLMEFRGAIHDEAGFRTRVDAKGILIDFNSIEQGDKDAMRDYFSREDKAVEIEALWCQEPGYSWTYSTAIPHTTFDVREGAEPYCRGIVFALADIAAAA